MDQKKARILVVDDHALVREMLEERLAQEPDLQVVGTAKDGVQALQMATHLQPDLVLLDIDMPGLSAFDAARQISDQSPRTRVLFLSGFVQDAYIAQALQARAGGYTTKSETPEGILRCVRKVLEGKICFCPEVSSRLEITDEGVRLSPGLRARIQLLTSRELEVLAYLGKGVSKKEIARTLGLSVKTVEQHSTNIMRKLDIHDRVQLARFAIREGLIQP